MRNFHLTGDRAPLAAALASAAMAFSYNFERYTSEVRYTDRVLRFPAVFLGEVRLAEPKFPVHLPDPELLYSTVTVSSPRTLVAFELPARQVCRLALTPR